MTDDPDTITISDGQPDAEARIVVGKMLPQLLIALVQRQGGECFIHVSEIDGTGPYNLAMRLAEDRSGFYFTVRKKGEKL